MPCGLSVGGCVRTEEGYGKRKQGYIFKRAVRCHLKADPSTRPYSLQSNRSARPMTYQSAKFFHDRN